MKKKRDYTNLGNPAEDIQWGPPKKLTLFQRVVPWLLVVLGITLFTVGYHHMMVVCPEDADCVANSIILGPRHWDNEFIVYGLLTIAGAFAWRSMQE